MRPLISVAAVPPLPSPQPFSDPANAVVEGAGATKGTKADIVAMVHVPSSAALSATAYTALLGGVPSATPSDNEHLARAVRQLAAMAEAVEGEKAYPLISQVAPVPTMCRSLVFLTSPAAAKIVAGVAEQCSLVQALVKRALDEVSIFVQNGIRCVEVENIAAPYFIGAGRCPWEELIILDAVVAALRSAYPNLIIGLHILSSNELEALPIAIRHGASFIRSEATVMKGLRPEGEVDNNGNLARFFYVRRVLRQMTAAAGTDEGHTTELYPMVWSDLQKKHTLFQCPELAAPLSSAWLDQITFMKLEGIIISGAATGKVAASRDLLEARRAVNAVKEFNKAQYGEGSLPALPVVTGSGIDWSTYIPLADYCIIGTAFKKGSNWEREVDPARVKEFMNKYHNL